MLMVSPEFSVPNIILGLALGYASVVVPITCITAAIGYAFATTGMYGADLSALGMLRSLLRCQDFHQRSEILLTPLMPLVTPPLLLSRLLNPRRRCNRRR